LTTETFEISDYLEIQTLLHQFNLKFDEGDGDGVAGLFTADGAISSGDKVRDSLEEIKAYVLDAAKRQTHRHFTTNIVIDPVPGDPLRANAQACFIYMTFNAGGPTTQSFGTYSDQLVKQDGRWFFERRTNVRAEPNQ
jgi:hypothetical protein